MLESTIVFLFKCLLNLIQSICLIFVFFNHGPFYKHYLWNTLNFIITSCFNLFRNIFLNNFSTLNPWKKFNPQILRVTGLPRSALARPTWVRWRTSGQILMPIVLFRRHRYLIKTKIKRARKCRGQLQKRGKRRWPMKKFWRNWGISFLSVIPIGNILNWIKSGKGK